jgi:hypothetical protein
MTTSQGLKIYSMAEQLFSHGTFQRLFRQNQAGPAVTIYNYILTKQALSFLILHALLF